MPDPTPWPLGTAVAVLVEGVSDQLAIEALAARHGIDFAAAHVAVVSMNGVTNTGRCLRARGDDEQLVILGLCDAAEERVVRRALKSVGIVVEDGSDGLAAAGFFVCDLDLEDELIRALGHDAMVRFIEEQGELDSLRTMQQMPDQRERTLQQQLRRFVGTRGGRKIRYAPLLIDALDLDRTPAPLAAVLERVAASVNP
ncbi:MAG: TOPRIM nucleotidyl transferase/hydrolase domain-containing protein [Ilumatobacteraceae bacterium]